MNIKNYVNYVIFYMFNMSYVLSLYPLMKLIFEKIYRQNRIR